jgi:hypothetical protein
MFDTNSIQKAPSQATIDYYVAKGRRERSRAFVTLIKAVFTAPEKAEAKVKTAISGKKATA